MDRQAQAKQTFIQAMRDLFPDNTLVQESADQAQEDDLNGIVNAMITGIATHPEYDALIPALQEVMDALREVKPDVNESAEKTVMALRAVFSSPYALPPTSQHPGETNEDFAKRIVRHTQEWTE